MRMLIGMFFKLKEGSRTRGHKAALVMEQCRLDMRKYSFSQRVINEWNKPPNDCVNASTVVPALNGHFYIQASVPTWQVSPHWTDICADDGCYQLT